MTDEQLTEFQKTGTMTVCGHELNSDEVKLKYAFDSSMKDATHDYDAHSDGEVRKCYGILKLMTVDYYFWII